MSVPAEGDIEDCRGKSWSSADGDLSVSHRRQWVSAGPGQCRSRTLKTPCQPPGHNRAEARLGWADSSEATGVIGLIGADDVGQAPIRVGDVKIAVVCEGFAPLPLDDELPDEPIDWDVERTVYPWAFHDARNWAWHVHSFALQIETGVVMIDTGVGHMQPYRPWVEHTDPDEALVAAGIDVLDVRTVVHTHLHADHAGGSVLHGRPRFPNAVHHIHPADWSYFGGPEEVGGYTARGLMAELERLGMLDLTEDDHEVAPGVHVIHTPGHTPGHRVAVLETGDDVLVLTGDLLHVPAQVAHPHARSSHDVDPDEGCRSRIRILSNAVEDDWRVAVSHFPRPFGRATADGWISQTHEATAGPHEAPRTRPQPTRTPCTSGRSGSSTSDWDRRIHGHRGLRE
jgi:glyoxylase-like metal-dependent hydrolase (beta-lactamase superfamily II)